MEQLPFFITSFIAGIIMFLMPCTLPLLPGYLAFITGSSLEDLKDPSKREGIRKKVFFNGLMYVLGFSIVFVLTGSVLLFFLNKFQDIFVVVGGVLIIIFGLFMMHVFKLPFFNFLNGQHKFDVAKYLHPGKPSSSFIMGATFAFGWTPCAGPIMGAVLGLALSSGTVVQGMVLLTIFSAGLALPFLLIAFGIGHALRFVKKVSKYLNAISFGAGLLVTFIGILMATGNISLLNEWVYRGFEFLNIDFEPLYDLL